jgi:hypothetical protein
MIPDIRSKIVERFVDNDFSEEEQNEFQSILLNDPTLGEDIRLSAEIDEALLERDIILLRSQLEKINKQMAITSGNEHPTVADACFGLPEEVFNPVNLEVTSEEPEVGNYLQQLHIKNHTVASKEVVHDLFSEIEGTLELDYQLMAPEDELLFEDIGAAMAEKDIIDLRANIQSIAQNISMHERTFEEIEDLVNGELDKEIETLICEEATKNSALYAEIDLHREINHAIREQDIMNLRAGLKEMMQNEYSHSRTFDEIDGYLRDELDEQALALFEDELITNSGLAADIAFHREVNKAITENDVMALRANLQDIFLNENDRIIEKLGIASPKRKKLYWYAAASIIILMVAFSSLMRHKTYSAQELYASYYQPYKNGMNISRSALTSVNELNSALGEIDRGNYPVALQLLKSVSAEEQDGFTINFYSGVAYQGLGEYRNAISSFTEVVRQGDNLLIEQSEWYIGLCYLRIEEREKALTQFRSIVSRNGFYREQSRKLLKQLE